jgi:hypothetical protein
MEASQIHQTGAMQYNKFSFRQECQEHLNRLKEQVVQRPFLSLALAFTAGLLAQTFPVRLLLLAVVKILSWLAGPAILVLGGVKAFEIFSNQFGADLLEKRG